MKKAVIPVAGKGTRFLPATKEVPKEMLPLLDRPMIHYTVLEAIEAGVEEVILVTAEGKESIEDYFSTNEALEKFLKEKNKPELLSKVVEVSNMVTIKSVIQPEALGLGHAVLMAKELVGHEPFVLLLADELMISEAPSLKPLLQTFEQKDASGVVGVMEVPRSQVSSYGIVAGDEVSEGVLKMTKMVEKPAAHEAPSCLATPGRYVFSSEIFSYIEKISTGAGGEYQLTDAINLMCQEKQVYSSVMNIKRFDTGQLGGYLQATVELALSREDTKEAFLDYLKERIK